MVIEYTPHAAQMEIHRARGFRFRTVCTGRRFGKTLCMAAELLDRGGGDPLSPVESSKARYPTLSGPGLRLPQPLCHGGAASPTISSCLFRHSGHFCRLDLSQAVLNEKQCKVPTARK